MGRRPFACPPIPLERMVKPGIPRHPAKFRVGKQ